MIQKMLVRKAILTLLLAVFVGSAVAGERVWKTFTGHVVGVVDGDTIDVLTPEPERELLRIRLMGIDAPEKRQAFGVVSKSKLAELVFGRDVRIDWHKYVNRNSRIVGQVFLSDGSDVNLAMVEAGMAWWYRAYAREQRPDDRARYLDAENRARKKGLGLWIDENPVAPWEFRHPKK